MNINKLIEGLEIRKSFMKDGRYKTAIQQKIDQLKAANGLVAEEKPAKPTKKTNKDNE